MGRCIVSRQRTGFAGAASELRVVRPAQRHQGQHHQILARSYDISLSTTGESRLLISLTRSGSIPVAMTSYFCDRSTALDTLARVKWPLDTAIQTERP